MKAKRSLLVVALVILSQIIIISSCKKEAGEGGSATIHGKVFAKYFNQTFTNLISTGYAPEVDVYIVYGDDQSFGNRTRSNYDGTYEFKYLRPGHYKVYVYSKDSTQSIYTIPSGKYAVSAEVEVGKKDKDVEIPDLIIFDNI
jgi:hypothetical protein